MGHGKFRSMGKLLILHCRAGHWQWRCWNHVSPLPLPCLVSPAPLGWSRCSSFQEDGENCALSFPSLLWYLMSDLDPADSIWVVRGEISQWKALQGRSWLESVSSFPLSWPHDSRWINRKGSCHVSHIGEHAPAQWVGSMDTPSTLVFLYHNGR